MIFIIIVLNKSMVTKLNYHSLIKHRQFNVWNEAEDLYQCFWKNKDKFDNGEYPENSPYFDKTNKKVIGKFENEGGGIPLVEFVGLRSKVCSYIKDNNKGGKTAKGIKKNVVKKNVKQEDYVLGSYEINKISAALMTNATSMKMV